MQKKKEAPSQKICCFCFQVFERKPRELYRDWINRKFCSRTCWSSSRRTGITKTEVLCDHCKQAIKREKWKIKEGRHNFCCPRCSSSFYRENESEKQKKARLEKKRLSNLVNWRKNKEKIMKKREKTCTERYGVSHFSKTEKFQKRMEQFFLDEEWSSKRAINISRTKLDVPEKDKKEIQKKRFQTNLERYNMPLSSKNASKISQRFFEELDKLLDFPRDTYFFSKNKEWFINSGPSIYFLDFFWRSKNKWIEFNGDYWHANPKKYLESDYILNSTAADIRKKDQERLLFIQKYLGAKCLVIWENEFKRDPLSTLEKAQKFLLEN